MAINLRAGALLRDWRPIAIYALLGTVFAALIVGGLTASALRIPLGAGLVFGALISATDPISVLAIFKRLHAERRLSLIIEAESLFNDGVAVVLFSVAMVSVAGKPITAVDGMLRFALTVAGGAALGAAVGWVGSRVHLLSGIGGATDRGTCPPRAVHMLRGAHLVAVPTGAAQPEEKEKPGFYRISISHRTPPSFVSQVERSLDCAVITKR